jgi:hypothetical protein
MFDKFIEVVERTLLVLKNLWWLKWWLNDTKLRKSSCFRAISNYIILKWNFVTNQQKFT